MLECHWRHCFQVMQFMIHMWLFHSITHKAFLTSHLNPHPGVTLWKTFTSDWHMPPSLTSPLQGTLPPARKSTIICVFRSQALCGSDWLTDRWQAVLLLHLLSVQITATCSVITVCKGCGSLCQRSNTLPLIAVKWTSSDVCRSWRSKSFFATLSTPISDPGQYAATPDKWWILAPASVGHENLRCITTVKGIFCSFSWSIFGFKSSMCSSLRKYPYTLKRRALHIICFDKCGCPPHSAGWATCQLAGFLRCPACQHRLPRRPAEHGFYLPCLSRDFSPCFLAKQTNT